MPFIKKNDPKKSPVSAKTRKTFIGRSNELRFFVECVLKPEEVIHNIISISGQGGVGKSTLLTQFIDEANAIHYKDYCLTALVDERQATPTSMMERFADQLSIKGEFEKAVNQYNEALRKLQIDQNNARDTFWRKTATDITGSLVKDVPVVGGILEKGATPTIGYLFDEIHYHHLLKDAKRLEDPISNLTKVFVEELNRLAEIEITLSSHRTKRRQRIILFFDTFEDLAPEAAPWLLDYFLQADINSNIVLVIAGRDSIDRSIPQDSKRWLPYYDNNIIYSIYLDSFTEEETRSYLNERNITDFARVATIWQLSHGLPLYLGLLTSNLRGDVDPMADVVVNFLRWIPEKEKIKRRLALDAALLSRSFNQDDLAAFTYYCSLDEDEQATLYHWLIGLPFVRSNIHDGRHTYHNIVQELFGRYLYQRSQREYYITRRMLADFYEGLLKKDPKGEKHNLEEHWLELLLALVHQLFFLPSEFDHIRAIEYVITAYYGVEKENESIIAKALRDLCQEPFIHAISPSAQQTIKMLIQFIEDDLDTQEFLIAITYILNKISQMASFSKRLLARVYRSRGNAYRFSKQYPQAIADFDHAIHLSPKDALLYSNRGRTYQDSKQYPQAIADFDHAIHLSPKDALLYTDRGRTYQDSKQYPQAIADFDHAIHLSPKDAWATLRRGTTYLSMGNFQEALKNFDRVIELDLDHKHYVQEKKGIALYELGRYQESVEAFNEALAISSACPVSWKALGKAYKALYTQDEAASLLQKTLVPDTDTIPVIRSRAEAMYGIECYKQALAEIDRAVQLNPNLSTSLSLRAYIYQSMNHLEEAMKDFKVSIELDKEFEHEGYKQIGRMLLSLERNQEAIDAFTKALITYPTCDSCWRLLNLAVESTKSTGYYEQALNDITQSIKLNPTNANFLVMRSEIYKALGRYEPALSDINCAMQIDQNQQMLVYNSRGLLLSYLGRYEEAIESYKQALKDETNSFYILYNIAVVMVHWKGLSNTQTYVDAAREALLALTDPTEQDARLYGLGGLEALIGNSDQALDYLQQIPTEVTDWARDDIAWLGLRTTPRFQALVFGKAYSQSTGAIGKSDSSESAQEA